jgi:dihydroorotase
LDISYDLSVINGRVYTPQGLKAFDIWVKDGKIAALGGSHRAEEKVDARGMLVLPGAIDAHVHFRDPGQTWKEDWESGSTAAVAGGVTTVVDQPNTDPRTLDRRSFEAKLEEAKRKSLVDFCINGGPGKVKELMALGITAIGEIFNYDYTDDNLQKLLAEVEKAGALPTIHAEDGEVVQEHTESLMTQMDVDVWSRARPNSAEAVALEKVLDWLGKRAHICHLSTRQGLEQIESFRALGKKITCEVAPHHLIFNRSDYKEQGTFLKMNPPLRSSEDNAALWMALKSGTIDILASDHAPHLPEEKKQEVWEAPSGVPGVETMLPLMLTAVRSNLLSLDRLVDAIATRPAMIFGLKSKGSIETSKDADLVLVDPKKITKVSADRLHSRADWTPYQGRDAIFPQVVLVRGAVVYDGDVAVRRGYGRFQKPV